MSDDDRFACLALALVILALTAVTVSAGEPPVPRPLVSICPSGTIVIRGELARALLVTATSIGRLDPVGAVLDLLCAWLGMHGTDAHGHRPLIRTPRRPNPKRRPQR